MLSAREEASHRALRRAADYLMAQLNLKAYPEEGFDIIVGKADMIPAFVRPLARSSRSGGQGRRPDLPPLAALFEAWPRGDFPRSPRRSPEGSRPRARPP